ncbi:unnamed protein product, partial [Didymodactylos carnosus]
LVTSIQTDMSRVDDYSHTMQHQEKEQQQQYPESKFLVVDSCMTCVLTSTFQEIVGDLVVFFENIEQCQVYLTMNSNKKLTLFIADACDFETIVNLQRIIQIHFIYIVMKKKSTIINNYEISLFYSHRDEVDRSKIDRLHSALISAYPQSGQKHKNIPKSLEFICLCLNKNVSSLLNTNARVFYDTTKCLQYIQLNVNNTNQFILILPDTIELKTMKKFEQLSQIKSIIVCTSDKNLNTGSGKVRYSPNDENLEFQLMHNIIFNDVEQGDAYVQLNNDSLALEKYSNANKVCSKLNEILATDKHLHHLI